MIMDKIEQDIITSMKLKDAFKRNTLVFIKSQILTEQKNRGKKLTDTEIQQLLMSEKSKRYDAIVSFKKVNRQDLVEQYNKEIMYINNYLPQPISDFELQQEIDNTIKELNATKKDKGVVIRTLKEKLALRVSPKHLSEKIIETLDRKG